MKPLSQQFDLVITGGQAMNLETGLDAQHKEGVKNGKVQEKKASELDGQRGDLR